MVFFFLGSISDNETYAIYARRFRNIYPPGSAPTMAYLAGDNDIGGEGGDRVTKAKVDRFRAYFPTKTFTKVKDAKVDLVVTDYLMTAGRELEPEDFSSVPEKASDRFRIAFSHLSVLPPSGR